MYPKTGEAPFVDQTFDNCGPYDCPKRGDVIDVSNKFNFDLYKSVIMRYEDEEDISSDGYSLFKNGVKIKNYTFKYDLLLDDGR